MSELLGDYQLEALIGRGGMAEVWRARIVRGPRAGQICALKRMLREAAQNPDLVDLFVSEADVSRNLRHPGIVEVLETGLCGESYYIAMEYLHGANLRQVIDRCKKLQTHLPIEVCCHIIVQVGEALSYAHMATAPNGTPLGIVHCDVSPANVFVARDGAVKLGDFGVVRLGAFEMDGPMVGGKSSYLAPEQIRRQRLSPATDVFALGAVLFEMLTLEKAFAGDSDGAIFRSILADEPPDATPLRPELPAPLVEVVRRTLAVQVEGERGLLWAVRGGRRPMRYCAMAQLCGDLRPFATAEQRSVTQVMRRLFGEG